MAPVPDHLEVRVDDPAGAWELTIDRAGGALDIVVRAASDVREALRQAEPELRASLADAGTPLGDLQLEAGSHPEGSERRERPAWEPPWSGTPSPRRSPVAALSPAAPHRVGRLLDRGA